jgi:hypothetical protein
MSEKEIDVEENRNGEEEEYTVNEDAVNENAEGIEDVDSSDAFMKALFEIGKEKQQNGDDVLRIFSDRDKEAKEEAKRAADERFTQDAFTGMAENYKQARKRDEEVARAAEETKRRELKPHPSFKKMVLRTVAGALALTTIAGVSANRLKAAHDKQREEIKTEAYDEGNEVGYNKGYEIGYVDGQQSVINAMANDANTNTPEGAITDVQHRDNVNKKLMQIKQEIADRYDSIEANDITISTERNSNGELQIKVTDKDGKEIPVDQGKEDEIKAFVEDYQNPMLDGNVTEAQKEQLQKELTEKESKEQEEQVKGKTITVLPEKEADDDTER